MLVPASVLGYSYLEKPSSLENSALSRGELLLRSERKRSLTWPRILILIAKGFEGVAPLRPRGLVFYLDRS